MTKEQEAIKAKIRELEATQAVVDAVKAVIREFDGKVYNCRLKNAITEKTACYAYENSYYTNDLVITRTGASSSPFGNVVWAKKSEFLDGKRINAAKLNAVINKEAADRQKKIFTLRGELTWIEGAVKGINEQIRLLNKMLDGISSETLDIYKNSFERFTYRLRY